MVSRLSYARTRSVALMYDSSTIATDQVAVQLRHWYGSNTLCRGCATLSRALLRSLTLKHDVRTFTGACRRFDTITHAHWRKPDNSRRSHTIKWKAACSVDIIISFHSNYVQRKKQNVFSSPSFNKLAIVAIWYASNIPDTNFSKLPNYIEICKNIWKSMVFPTRFTKQYHIYTNIDCIYQSYPLSYKCDTKQMLSRTGQESLWIVWFMQIKAHYIYQWSGTEIW